MISKENLEKINFCIRRAMTDTMPVQWELFPRNIFDHELLFVEKGCLTFTLDGKNYEANEGDIILIPPKIPHAIKTHSQTRLTQPHVHFDFEYKDDFSKVYVSFKVIKDDDPDAALFRENYWEKLGLPYLIHPSHSIVKEKILSLIKDIIHLQISTDPCDVFVSKYKLSQIIFLIIQDTKGKIKNQLDNQTRYENLYELTDLFIEKNVLGILDLEELSKMIGYSKNYVSTLYKTHFGITPSHKHEILKMEKAKEYMFQENVTVTEIADLLGYPSISDFSRAFKKHYGVSPSAFRKSLK